MDQEYLPDIPIFVYHGSLDGIVPIPDVHGVYRIGVIGASTHLSLPKIH